MFGKGTLSSSSTLLRMDLKRPPFKIKVHWSDLTWNQKYPLHGSTRVWLSLTIDNPPPPTHPKPVIFYLQLWLLTNKLTWVSLHHPILILTLICEWKPWDAIGSSIYILALGFKLTFDLRNNSVTKKKKSITQGSLVSFFCKSLRGPQCI